MFEVKVGKVANLANWMVEGAFSGQDDDQEGYSLVNAIILQCATSSLRRVEQR